MQEKSNKKTYKWGVNFNNKKFNVSKHLIKPGIMLIVTIMKEF